MLSSQISLVISARGHLLVASLVGALLEVAPGLLRHRLALALAHVRHEAVGTCAQGDLALHADEEGLGQTRREGGPRRPQGGALTQLCHGGASGGGNVMSVNLIDIIVSVAT